MPLGDDELLSVLRHPVRQGILRVMLMQPGRWSPKELAYELTGGKEKLSQVGYHVTVLRDHTILDLVGEEFRRGALEHYYEVRNAIGAKPWLREALGLPLTKR